MRRVAGVLLCGCLLLAGAASCTSNSGDRQQARRPPVQPTATVTFIATATATVTATPTGTPSPTPSLDPALAHLLKVIHSKGYETTTDELQKAADFAPALLAVLVAKPGDLGNGFRCATVFFFANGNYVGQDSTACHLFPQISWGTDTEISIVYPRYAADDPNCCPTLNPERVIFRLEHGHMRAVSGAPPRP